MRAEKEDVEGKRVRRGEGSGGEMDGRRRERGKRTRRGGCSRGI